MSGPQQMLLGGAGGDYISTPLATPSLGASFEGGYYGGLIWNQIAQSSTSTAIATGVKNFTVASMSATPIVYVGQTLEIRSRANPANQMVGTVLAAAGTNLTVSVTSVGGSGTFTDWSVMARFRVIVSPKASGTNGSIAVKNAATALPTGCQTAAEGWLSTNAMTAAGNSTVYPAAHWCRALTIGGYSDWYLASRDEFELLYRNLFSWGLNANGARSAASYSYGNLGSYADVTNSHGVNLNSSPQGSAYTSSVPGVGVLRSTAEELDASANYLGSSAFSTSANFATNTFNPNFGAQATQTLDSARVVRAVRRSII